MRKCSTNRICGGLALRDDVKHDEEVTNQKVGNIDFILNMSFWLVYFVSKYLLILIFIPFTLINFWMQEFYRVFLQCDTFTWVKSLLTSSITGKQNQMFWYDLYSELKLCCSNRSSIQRTMAHHQRRDITGERYWESWDLIEKQVAQLVQRVHRVLRLSRYCSGPKMCFCTGLIM